ncbi:hypothetical protein K8S19_11140 [bacterium]|nr:hypothetical protein [bacterium]
MGNPERRLQFVAIMVFLLINIIMIPVFVFWFTPWKICFGLDGPVVKLLYFLVILLIGGCVWLLGVSMHYLYRLGFGTFSPWNPTKKLVVQGVYAHVRNPMILGIMGILLGGGLVFGSIYLLVWILPFFVGNTLYVAWSEEPGLYKRFGPDYMIYLQNVPRWLPRWKPWIEVRK